jgi:hypothetical protein
MATAAKTAEIERVKASALSMVTGLTLSVSAPVASRNPYQ